ncbi:MAG: TIGR02099 family protein, partial [Comamonas sp.]|nr:TIGR02099 family protein [Comamonas sp.]
KDKDKGTDLGILQLQGSLAQANGARVHRYLPLSIPAEVRHYVRDSVLAGQGRDVRFEVAGALRDMPFRQPGGGGGGGRFHISAPVYAVDYDYLPASLLASGHAPWPGLRQLAGVLQIDGQGMRILQAQAQVQAPQGIARVAFEQVQAEIADWHHPVVQVQGRSQDSLAAMLQVLRHSAVQHLTADALARAQGQGQVALDLQLSIPLQAPQHSRVKGSVQFLGRDNQLQLRPDVPALTQLQGRVHFHEQGFALEGVQAQALGGAVQLSGGMADLQTGVRLEAQGHASAQGLKQGAALAVVQALAAQAHGQASYQLLVQSQGAGLEIEVQSDLRGLALDLPAPLGKAASSVRPLLVRYQPAAQKKSGAVDSLEVALGSADAHAHGDGSDGGEAGHLRYLLDSHSGQARAGWLYWGAAAQQRPNTLGIADGVQAQVQTGHLDIDAWAAQMSQLAAGADGAQPQPAPWHSFLPQRLQLQAGQLHWQQRQLHQVQAQISQQQGRWRGQIQAKELAGYVDYQPQHPYAPAGLVFVRLAHLHIPPASPVPPAAASATEPAPANSASTSTSNGVDTWPALDIHVQALQVAGKDLGQLFVRARSQGGQTRWALERFELRTPEARWRSQGWWQAASTGAGQAEHTALQFTLEMHDGGQLLTRLGMAGVLQQGKGDPSAGSGQHPSASSGQHPSASSGQHLWAGAGQGISGQMQWQGSPLQPDWHSMRGQVALELGAGQFLKVEPGMAKLLSVLSLQSIGKRLSGDFRDIFSSGFAFDFVRGDIDISEGIARTNNLQMQGLNAAVLMQGEANLQTQTQALRLVIVPEINAMTASLVASAINPVAGLGSLLAQALLRKPMMAAATREFIVSGSWAEPVVRPASDSPASTTDPHPHPHPNEEP